MADLQRKLKACCTMNKGTCTTLRLQRGNRFPELLEGTACCSLTPAKHYEEKCFSTDWGPYSSTAAAASRIITKTRAFISKGLATVDIKIIIIRY
jgi:hypothetical protein